MNAAGAVRRKMVIKFVLGAAAANCTKFLGRECTHHKKVHVDRQKVTFKCVA